jgi:hypothetical protein
VREEGRVGSPPRSPDSGSATLLLPRLDRLLLGLLLCNAQQHSRLLNAEQRFSPLGCERAVTRPRGYVFAARRRSLVPSRPPSTRSFRVRGEFTRTCVGFASPGVPLGPLLLLGHGPNLRRCPDEDVANPRAPDLRPGADEGTRPGKCSVAVRFAFYSRLIKASRAPRSHNAFICKGRKPQRGWGAF